MAHGKVGLAQGLGDLIVLVRLEARLPWKLCAHSSRSSVDDDYGAVAGRFLVGDVAGFGHRLEGRLG